MLYTAACSPCYYLVALPAQLRVIIELTYGSVPVPASLAFFARSLSNQDGKIINFAAFISIIRDISCCHYGGFRHDKKCGKERSVTFQKFTVYFSCINCDPGFESIADKLLLALYFQGFVNFIPY